MQISQHDNISVREFCPSKSITTHHTDLDLKIIRFLAEYGELELIDCVRFRLVLRWRYIILDYLCQLGLVPFDLNDILLSSLVEVPLANLLPDGQLSSFLTLACGYGEKPLINFSEKREEAMVLGVLLIHLRETFASPSLQKEVLNEAVISLCMLLTRGLGSPPKPPTEELLR